MSNKLSLTLVSVLAAAAFAGCSASSTINIAQANAVSSSEQTTVTAVAAFATTTPPSNGTSMGMQSSPAAGPVTIPITNVEVYTFTASVGESDDETLYWAADEDTVYVWGQIALDCVDDNGESTGETGTADLVYETSSDGYGWLTATDSCGYSTFYGCSADSGESETCGGCDFNDEFIACSASS